MRKVVAVELVSLDGVFEAPEGWTFSYSDEEMQAANAAGMASSDALLLGRVTYEQMAGYWPEQPGGTPMVDYINSVRKVVVSGSLQEPLRWNNSVLFRDNVAEKVSRLKQQPGKDITVIGSGALVRSLIGYGLLDELRLTVHPLILGKGKRLFEDGEDTRAFELVESRAFGTGVVSLSYRPEGG